MKRVLALGLLLGVLFATGSAMAAMPKKPEPVIGKLDPTQFPALAALIRGEMGPGGRWEYMKAKERMTIEVSLDTMERTLAGHQDVAELTEYEKVEVLNAQEQINAILTRRDKDRLICERRKIVGSQLPQNVCETYGEKVRRNAEAKERYFDLEDVILQKPIPPEDR